MVLVIVLSAMEQGNLIQMTRAGDVMAGVCASLVMEGVDLDEVFNL